MFRILDLQNNLPLGTRPLHFCPKQVSKNISTLLFAQTNLTKPLVGSEPHRPPTPLEFVSPVSIPNIRCDFFPTTPPISQGGYHEQGSQHRNANSNTQSKSRLQGIKRPHRAIRQRDKRNQC